MVKKMGISMTWDKFNKIFVTIFSLFVLFGITNQAFAITETSKVPTIAVISDSAHRNGTTYLICGAASDIFATDIINRLNQTGHINAPLLGENMANISKSIPLYTYTFYNEYKYNYNIDFVNLKRITKNISADYVLMITSGLDIQSELFKENWWNKWGLSSSQPITPTYKLITMLTLIDKSTYNIVWQDMYKREIKAENMDLGITQFSPNYSQLTKIKKYSTTMSEYVVNNIEKVIVPTKDENNSPKAVEMKGRFINEGTKIYYPTVNGEVVKQNFDETRQNISDFTSEQQRKWRNFQQQRQQKKNIENVNKIELKKQIKNPEVKTKENLFDSIRNNVDDMSNSLPEVKKESSMTPVNSENVNIKPVVDVIKPVSNNETEVVVPNDKIITPVSDDAPVNVNDIPKNHEYVTPIEHVEPRKPVDYQTPKNHVPRYDWNLKNIYLQKIGLSNLY